MFYALPLENKRCKLKNDSTMLEVHTARYHPDRQVAHASIGKRSRDSIMMNGEGLGIYRTGYNLIPDSNSIRQPDLLWDEQHSDQGQSFVR